jgi:glutamate dehydrogenase/leucine dehydrogenase
MGDLNLFTIAQQQLDTAAARLGLDAATHELLRWPQKRLVVTILVQMDYGQVKVFRGYRLQYICARGPYDSARDFIAAHHAAIRS